MRRPWLQLLLSFVSGFCCCFDCRLEQMEKCKFNAGEILGEARSEEERCSEWPAVLSSCRFGIGIASPQHLRLHRQLVVNITHTGLDWTPKDHNITHTHVRPTLFTERFCAGRLEPTTSSGPSSSSPNLCACASDEVRKLHCTSIPQTKMLMTFAQVPQHPLATPLATHRHSFHSRPRDRSRHPDHSIRPAPDALTSASPRRKA